MIGHVYRSSDFAVDIVFFILSRLFCFLFCSLVRRTLWVVVVFLKALTSEFISTFFDQDQLLRLIRNQLQPAVAPT